MIFGIDRSRLNDRMKVKLLYAILMSSRRQRTYQFDSFGKFIQYSSLGMELVGTKIHIFLAWHLGRLFYMFLISKRNYVIEQMCYIKKGIVNDCPNAGATARGSTINWFIH